MRFRTLIPLALLATSVAACDRVLQTEPPSAIPGDKEIVDAATAQAALNGAYDALQSGGYYGLDVPLLGDMPSDNDVFTGTYQFLQDMTLNRIQADNPEITSMWTAIYRQIDRDNVVITKVPQVAGIPDAVKKETMGEAYFLRALSYHNLVKFFAAVPTPTAPVISAADAQKYTRTPVDQVYAQIMSDLDKAGQLISNTANTRQATSLAVKALRARVLLYRASLAGNSNAAADYQAALDTANAVLAGRDTLTVVYGDLFSPAGTATSEDVFSVSFTASESNSLGYYYLIAGRAEAMPSPNLDAAYEPGDVRHTWSIKATGNANHPLSGTKYPTTAGTEHVHAIRLAEIVLIKAEVLARQNRLDEAVAEYNKVRVRAGLPKHVLGVNVTTQADVLAAIDKERRLEFAFEGDRWPDLVRLGRAAIVKGFTDRPGQALFPIPLREVTNTNPPLPQNPGY